MAVRFGFKFYVELQDKCHLQGKGLRQLHWFGVHRSMVTTVLIRQIPLEMKAMRLKIPICPPFSILSMHNHQNPANRLAIAKVEKTIPNVIQFHSGAFKSNFKNKIANWKIHYYLSISIVFEKEYIYFYQIVIENPENFCPSSIHVECSVCFIFGHRSEETWNKTKV